MADHGPYDREEYGHEEHIPASPGWNPDNDDEEVEREYGPEQGFHEVDDPDSESEDIEREVAEDEANEAWLSQEKKKAYEARKARESERTANAKKYAAAAERVRRGVLHNEYHPQSKRLINWAVIPRSGQVSDRPAPAEVEAIVKKEDVEAARERVKKEKNLIADLSKERRDKQFELLALINQKKRQGEIVNKALDRRISQRQRQANRLKEGLDTHYLNLNSLHKQAGDVTKRFLEQGGQIDQAGTIHPPQPSLHGEGGGSKPSPTKRLTYDKDGNPVVINDEAVRAYPLKREVKRFNELNDKLRKHPGGPITTKQGSLVRGAKRNEGLTYEEYKEYKRLDDLLHFYRVVIVPDEEGNDPTAAAYKKLQEKVKYEFPIEHVPEKETAEDVIAEHGQEEAHAPLIGTYRDKRGNVKRDVLGWRATTAFNKNQYERTYNAMRTGEASFGWGQHGVSGYHAGAPVEKAKLTVGPNADWLMTAHDWTPADPSEAEKGQDVFTVYVPDSGRETHTNAEGEYYQEGLTVKDTVNNLGLGLKVTGSMTGMYRIHTDQGEHLNPDQIDALREALHVYHGASSANNFHSEGTIGYRRTHKRVPVGYSKQPKAFKEDEAIRSRRTIYQGRMGARFGQRNADTGELEAGERDTLGLHIGPWALQRHLREDTDAIGWGRSWRPGEKEVSGAVMAVPKFRQQKEMGEAWQASIDGNDAPMQAYLNKYYPDDDPSEREEHENKVKSEGKLIMESLTAGAYYSHKKGFPSRLGNQAWAGFQKVPKVGPASYNLAERHNLLKERGGLFRDANWTYRRIVANKLDRAVNRVQHPLQSGMVNPVTGELEFDPTVPGIMFHNEYKPHLPSAYYRKHFRITPGQFHGRQIEKEYHVINSMVNTQRGIQQTLTGKTPANRLARMVKLREAQLMLHDPRNKATGALEQQLITLKNKIDTFVDSPERQFELMGKKANTTLSKEPEMKEILVKLKPQVDKLLADVQADKTLNNEHLTNVVKSYVGQHPSKVPAAIWKTSKFGLIGGAALGGTALAVDRYQVYRHNRGEQVRHPILNAVVPERIMIPDIKVKKTREYAIPHNALTDALDFQGEKVPVSARISVGRKEKYRIRNHTDISGEKYKPGLPLFGGMGLTPPAPVKGSMKKAFMSPSPSSGFGPTKNIYVGGAKVPIDITMGKKERWDNRSHKLRSTYNRYKLDQEDREHLAQLATTRTEGGQYTLTPEGERLSSFYYDDPKFQEMLEDQDDLTRIDRKYVGWREGGKSKAAIDTGQIKGRMGVGISQQRSQTVEEARQAHSTDRRARRDWQQAKREGQ